MRFKTLTALSALFVNLFIAQSIHAGQTNAEGSCGLGSYPMRIAVRHIEPNGIGYNQGYTTAEGFFSLYNGWEKWGLFLDTRVHVFNNGQPAVNAGLLTRYMANSRIWGGNAYYDYRKTKHYHYNQITVGLETLGNVWDFRINGYAPVGSWSSPYYHLDFAYFEGHSAILREKYEYALGGFNAEAAAHVDKWDHYPLYFAAGPYYLNGRGGSAWGGQLRASVTIYDYLKIDGNLSYDHLFKWIGQGEVGLTFAFGKRKEIKSNNTSSCSMLATLSERMVQPVDRLEIIPVDHAADYAAAINPLTDEPYYFAFVDNLSSSLGTYESPYPTLSDAATNTGPHDVIYIFPGDGTTTGMSSGITLQDYQRLWGSGVTQSLPIASGIITIPAQTSSTFNGFVFSPSISNTTPGNVVTAANYNEISGLFIQNQSTYSCVSVSDSTNLSVLNSTLAAAHAAGEFGISASGLVGTLTVSNCDINQKVNNIHLTNTAGNLTTVVSNCTIDNSTTTSTPAINWTLSNAAQGSLTIENSTIASASDAVDITLSDTSTIATTVNNNQITSNGYGFNITSSSGSTDIALAFQDNNIASYYIPVNLTQTGTLTGTFNGNTMLASDSYAFQLIMNSGSTDTTLVMSQNTLNSTDDYAIYIDQTAGNLAATFTDSVITSTDDEYSVYILESGSAETQTLNFYDNTIYGYYGLYLESSVGTQTLDITGNTIVAYEYPFYFEQSGPNIATATINNNVMNSIEEDYCFYWYAAGTGSNQVSASGNNLNGYYGLYLDQNNTGTSTITFNDNTGLCYDGVYIDVADGTANFSMTGNNFTSYLPVYIDQSGGTATISIIDNSLIASGPNSVYHTVGGGTSTFTANGNTISSSGSSSNAAMILTYASATATATISDNALNCPTGAILGEFGAGTYDVTVSDNVVRSGGGVSLTAESTSSSTFYVNGNQFTALNSASVAATASNTADLCMHLNDNTTYPIAGAYTLTNSGTGTFTLNTPTGNIGQITESGTITPGTCP